MDRWVTVVSRTVTTSPGYRPRATEDEYGARRVAFDLPTNPRAATRLECLIGRANIAVQECRPLQLSLTVSIITRPQDDFIAFGSAILRREARG
jgi:hypothetical protein